MDKKESLGIAAAIATIVGAIFAILSYVAPIGPAIQPPPAISSGPVPTAPQDQPPVGAPQGEGEQPPPSRTPKIAPAQSELLPLAFSLADGEQKIMLEGQASIGTTFNTVDGVDLITLIVNSSGSQSARYPFQGSGHRVEFTLGALSYYVYLQDIDWRSKTVQLRLFRAL